MAEQAAGWTRTATIPHSDWRRHRDRSSAVGVWLYRTAGRETTDDAQVDAHVAQISARVGGTVLRVLVKDNQQNGCRRDAGGNRSARLSDRRRAARAELLDAEAAAKAARSNVPITSTTAAGGVTNAQSAIEQANASDRRGRKGRRSRAGAAGRRLVAGPRNRGQRHQIGSRRRTPEGLLAKDEVSQQQYDTAVATAESQRAAVDAAKSQVVEAETGIRAAESRLVQARTGVKTPKPGCGPRRRRPSRSRPSRRARPPPRRTPSRCGRCLRRPS